MNCCIFQTVNHNISNVMLYSFVHVFYVCILKIIIVNWDSFHENGPSFIIIKSYKIAMYLNRNYIRTVKAIDFLFSTLHTTLLP